VSSPRRPARRFALCTLALLLTACGTTLPGAGAEMPADHVHRSKSAAVRIEPIEAGAPDNAHPATVPARALRRTLEGLRAARTISISPKPVFTAEELDEIVAPLAAALAKAGAREDVVFVSRGFHGIFGKYSTATVTTGRMFVHEGRINIIFGLLHDQVDQLERVDEAARKFVPGSRAQPLATGWEIAPDGSVRVHERRDWISFEVPSAVEPAAVEAAPARGADAAAPAPQDNARYQEIEAKLKLLDRLKANELISEEEYREQRRSILQGL
jgi:hypothetical protein